MGCGIKLTLLRSLSLVAIAGSIGLIDSALRPFSVSLGGPTPVGRHAPEPEPAAPGPADDSPHARVSTTAAANTPAATTASEVASGEGFIDTETTKALHDRMFQQGDVTFVDARNADEFAAAHIPGSLNIPPDAFFGGALPAAMDLAPKSYTIVVYCGGGECDASKLVALRFKEQGYATVHVYQAGWAGWTAAKLPTQKGGQ